MTGRKSREEILADRQWRIDYERRQAMKRISRNPRTAGRRAATRTI